MTRIKWVMVVVACVVLAAVPAMLIGGCGAAPGPAPPAAAKTLRADAPEPSMSAAPPAASGRTSQLDYTVLAEETYDAPVKTQVILRVLVPANASRADLQALLETLYSSVAARRGYDYHDTPTSIWIEAFTSREFAESSMGQWIAMLGKAHSDSGPTMSFNEAQFAQRTAIPEIRFGLSEEQRKEIFYRLGEIGIESQAAADRAHPYGPSATREELMAWSECDSEFRERKHQELADRYDITTDELSRIVGEGVLKDWLSPPA